MLKDNWVNTNVVVILTSVYMEKHEKKLNSKIV